MANAHDLGRGVRPADRGRRTFLTRCGLLVGGVVMAACGGGGGTKPALAERARAYDADLVCDDVSGLWPVEIATRTDNEYTQSSNKPQQYCFNCSNFIEPKRAGACATCRTVKGPIQPLGWCKSWTEKKG